MINLCIKIIIARIMDVSLNTVRTMFVVKGSKYVASIIAFVEILIWFYAVREALNINNTSIFIALSYAFGYASGTCIGTFINDTYISGIYNIQVISSKITEHDILKIKKNNFGVSVINASDNKFIIYISVNKKNYKRCINLVKELDEESFIVVNEAKIAYNGYIT